MDEDILRKLEERLGPLYARLRLGIETDQEAQIFGQSLLSFHIVSVLEVLESDESFMIQGWWPDS